MKRIPIYLLAVLAAACTLPTDKKVEAAITDTANVATSENNAAATAAPAPKPEAEDHSTIPLPAPQTLRAPSGIYQTFLPLDGRMEQTIAFFKDQTYQLQETYHAKKDSVVITRGNWSPSDGFIWLYQDQVVRGRYKWNGDTLQYFSPSLNKNFSMRPLNDALEHRSGVPAKDQDLLLFGSGNEPFWSLSYNSRDSVSFLLAGWSKPLQLRITSANDTRDSSFYTAASDSAAIRITVYPYFCNDGMSDLVYHHKVRVQYNNQVYTGCGMVYR